NSSPSVCADSFLVAAWTSPIQPKKLVLGHRCRNGHSFLLTNNASPRTTPPCPENSNVRHPMRRVFYWATALIRLRRFRHFRPTWTFSSRSNLQPFLRNFSSV